MLVAELGTWLEAHTVPNASVNGIFSLEIEVASLANKIFIIHKIGCCVIAQNSEWNCSFDLLCKCMSYLAPAVTVERSDKYTN